MITIQTQLSFDQLLEAVRQLNPTELDRFQQRVLQLRASKHNASLSKWESDLLIKINSVSSPQQNSRYQTLLTKRRDESLTESEYEELIALGDQYEQQNAERIKHLAQLAEIKEISVTDLMDQLEIPQPTHS